MWLDSGLSAGAGGGALAELADGTQYIHLRSGWVLANELMLGKLPLVGGLGHCFRLHGSLPGDSSAELRSNRLGLDQAISTQPRFNI